jgi:hypothetical protein
MLSHTPVREVIEEARSLTNCMKIVVLHNFNTVLLCSGSCFLLSLTRFPLFSHFNEFCSVCLSVIIQMTCKYIFAYLGTQALVLHTFRVALRAM